MQREAGGEPETPASEKSRAPGARVIQIPLEWPARYGTVLDVNRDGPATAVLIGWDDGRRDRIEDAEIRPLRIWFISDEPMRGLKAGPLESHLAKFMIDVREEAPEGQKVR